MRTALSLIFCFQFVLLWGQSNPGNYRFSKDILIQIEKDTVVWKYQTGATEMSFSGYYEQVLHIWDKNGVRKPKNDPKDSLYIVNSQLIPAREYIIQQAKKAPLVIINEAHHLPSHRMFTRSLLQDLYDNGYRYLGLEALFDPAINQRKFAVQESGYYIQEPEFGNLIYEALRIGYTLFGYEAASNKNGKEREIEQAENIQEFIKNNPDGKVLIHCGYAHAFENVYNPWEKAMAGRLKDMLQVDPFTIDQTMFLEKSDPQNNTLFTRMNTTQQPVVLIDENGAVFRGKNTVKQTDVVVIHPPTVYINQRPSWQFQGKEKYTISLAEIQSQLPVLVAAYRVGEYEKNGIPADLIEITNSNSPRDLYLKKGRYTLVFQDKNYLKIDQYDVVIQ